MLLFESEEARVRVWIDQIDKWIAAANQKLAAQMAGSVATREVGGDEREQKLREVTDRLKGL
ncbi:MAG TPA: hypothetical protein VHF87_08015 [Methylomirabilota bacterium]|nr:hypothetical protein [Methylomirabilota bacterium]